MWVLLHEKKGDNNNNTFVAGKATAVVIFMKYQNILREISESLLKLTQVN